MGKPGKHHRNTMKNKTRKAQSAIEFLAYIGITLVVLTGLMTAVNQQQNQALLFSNSYEAQQLAQDIAFHAEMALVQGPEYSREFTVPNRVGGQNYTIYITESTTVIEMNRDGNITAPSLYSGEMIKHSVQATENDLKIQHINPGEIQLETANEN